MEKNEILKYCQLFDHTKLSANATFVDIEKLCQEAIDNNFYSVCVNPFYVDYAVQTLKNTNVKVCAVIGFPLGQNTIETKVYEAHQCILNGANEIDMVINIAQLQKQEIQYCVQEINAIKAVCGQNILKVIVETCLLSTFEKKLAAKIVLNSNADFIKTSTGFSTAGATFEDIQIFKEVVGDKKLIKAAGGIKTASDLIKMVELGANRIGTSKGVELVKQLLEI
ncbi:MAG: deoxyribose-phosphate aldolase [Malacoplasma sp.]|nr:deoxyribose-phosphate aldolase [Malacoplasma sp.]